MALCLEAMPGADGRARELHAAIKDVHLLAFPARPCNGAAPLLALRLQALARYEYGVLSDPLRRDPTPPAPVDHLSLSVPTEDLADSPPSRAALSDTTLKELRDNLAHEHPIDTIKGSTLAWAVLQDCPSVAVARTVWTTLMVGHEERIPRRPDRHLAQMERIYQTGVILAVLDDAIAHHVTDTPEHRARQRALWGGAL